MEDNLHVDYCLELPLDFVTTPSNGSADVVSDMQVYMAFEKMSGAASESGFLPSAVQEFKFGHPSHSAGWPRSLGVDGCGVPNAPPGIAVQAFR